MQIKESLQGAARAGAIATGRIALITALGVLLNWGFLLLKGGWLRSQGTVIFVLLLALFSLVLPILYFVVGQKYALGTVLQLLFRQNKDQLLGFFTTSAVTQYQQRVGPGTVASTTQISDIISRVIGSAPKPLRWVFQHLLKKIPLREQFLAATEGVDMKPENTPIITQRLNESLGSALEDRLFRPSLTLFWVLLVVNAGLIFAVLRGLG